MAKTDERRTQRASASSSAVSTAAAVSLACALLASCKATRQLEITSEPPGAEVRVDDVLVGTTPMRLAFKDYGTRRVTLYKPGYFTSSKLVELDPPWYAEFPIDFLTEVLVPVGWHDVQPYDAALEAGSGVIATPELEDVLKRAEALRRAGPSGPARHDKPPVDRPPADGPPSPLPLRSR